MEVDYQPFLQRTPDDQYRRALKAIIDRGVKARSAHETGSITLFGQTNFSFDATNGFALIPNRNLNPTITEKVRYKQWQQAIGELAGFYSGVHTQEDLEAFGCYTFWKDTVTGEEGAQKCRKRGLVEGDLGPASYGGVFANFPLIDARLITKLEGEMQPDTFAEFKTALEKVGTGFNQVTAILRQIKERPELRTHFLDPWYSPGIWRWDQQVVVCPCHGWVHIRILEDGKLYYHMFQRSGDMLLGVPNNMTQHMAMAMAFARATGYPLARYSHTVSDAHIYTNHIDAAYTLLERPDRRLPTMHLREGIDDFFAIRPEDFELTDYFPHLGIPKIELGLSV